MEELSRPSPPNSYMYYTKKKTKNKKKTLFTISYRVLLFKPVISLYEPIIELNKAYEINVIKENTSSTFSLYCINLFKFNNPLCQLKSHSVKMFVFYIFTCTSYSLSIFTLIYFVLTFPPMPSTKLDLWLTTAEGCPLARDVDKGAATPTSQA